MNSKDTYDMFNNLINDNKIVCTQSELEEFMIYGILFNSGDRYITRDKQIVDVKLIKEKHQNFDINFNNIIGICEQLAKENNTKRVYCMSQRCYDKYKEDGLIITYNNQEYYRLFDKEKWLVYVIN